MDDQEELNMSLSIMPSFKEANFSSVKPGDSLVEIPRIETIVSIS
jgi:hypothetical protein